MELMVLLIMQYLILKILVVIVLNVYARGTKIKKISQSRSCYNVSSTKKVYGKILVLVYTWRILCSLRERDKMNGWFNF
jgi:hypothetical protein